MTLVRWTLAIATGFTTMALFLFSFIYWQTAIHEQTRIDAMLVGQAQQIAEAPDDAGQLLLAWLADDLHDVRYGALFGPTGARLVGNLLALPDRLPADGLAHPAIFGPIGRDRDGDVAETVRGVARRLPDGRLLALGYDIDELEEVRDVVLRGLGFALLPALLLSLAGGAILARRGQQRVVAVHQALERIMQGHLRDRLPVHGMWDDFDKLAAAVNRMLDQVERLVTELRGVGDHIAHDLRTPLTRVRMRLERGRDEAHTREEFQATADRAIVSVDQALAVISAVLRIGEVEHGQRRAAFAPVDLAAVLREAAELYEPLAEECCVALRLDIAPAPPVPGDHDLLLEALGNLADNAIKFAPAGTVVLSLAPCPGGQMLAVTDQGPGIPPDEREHVLHRFYRADRSRSVAGSGLGLSLVAAVVALHGFRLRIGDVDGRGCRIEIFCPTKSG